MTAAEAGLRIATPEDLIVLKLLAFRCVARNEQFWPVRSTWKTPAS
jgi:hypothetical protein